MNSIIALTLAFVLAASPAAWASQQNASPALEVSGFQQMASAIPLGARVRLQTRAGRRLTATLMSVTGEAIVVKRESRVPEPALEVRFDELASLKRHEPRGMGLGKALAIGLSAGAGAMLTLFAIFLSVED